MKKKEEPLRNCKCTDATLKQTVDTVIESAERDITEFNSRGVTPLVQACREYNIESFKSHATRVR